MTPWSKLQNLAILSKIVEKGQNLEFVKKWPCFSSSMTNL